MSLLAVLAALIVALLCGYGLLRWLGRGVGEWYWVEVAGFSWLLGSVAVSAVLAVGGLFASYHALFATAAIAPLGISIAALARADETVRIRFFPTNTRTWEKLLTALIAVPVVTLFVLSFREVLAWDGILVWEIKARIAFLHGGALPREYFADPLLAWSHPSYPLYLPMVDLFAYLWLGEPHQYWIKAIFPLFYLAGGAVLWSAGLRLTGRVWIGAAAALLLFAIPRAVTARGGVLQGYADLPLALFYIGALAALFIGARMGADGSSRGWFRLAAACAAALPWVKQEGIVLLVSFAIVAAWIFHGRWRAALAVSLPGLLVAACWRTFLIGVGVLAEKTFHPLTFETLQKNVHRVGPLLVSFGEEFTRHGSWNLLWPLAAFALAAMHVRRDRVATPLLLALAVPLAFDFVPYIFTALEPYEWHVHTSLDRLFLQLAPVAALALALAADTAAGHELRREAKPPPGEPEPLQPG